MSITYSRDIIRTFRTFQSLLFFTDVLTMFANCTQYAIPKHKHIIRYKKLDNAFKYSDWVMDCERGRIRLLCPIFHALIGSIMYKQPAKFPCSWYFIVIIIKLSLPTYCGRYCGQLQGQIITRKRIYNFNWNYNNFFNSHGVTTQLDTL
jgi:hypothetical protein